MIKLITKLGSVLVKASAMVTLMCVTTIAYSLEIKHAMGTTTLSKTPSRVIVLDNGAFDNLLALGVKPIGATAIFLDKPFMEYLGSQVNGVKKVGTIDQPNLEAITAQKPDLIIGAKDLHEAIYSKLSQIAPTVFTETFFEDLEGRLTLHALAVGKSEKAKSVIADYESKVSKFKALNLNKEVSVLRGRSSHVTIYLAKSWSGSLVEEVGLQRPASQRDTSKWSLKVTEEQVADIDGDAILWFSRTDENYLTKNMQSSRLWNTLNAVKNNHVYRLDAGAWLSGMGIQSRNHMLDDVTRIFSK